MQVKKIVVVYNQDDWSLDIPISSVQTRKSFEDWHERGIKNGIEIYRASINWYNKKGHFFKKSWAYRNKKWLKINTPVKPDLIFDKLAGRYDYSLFELKMLISQKIKIFNHPIFRTMLDNKLSQVLFLGDFMPKSFLAVDQKSFLEAITKINSSKVVVKPLYGSGGFGIIIENKKNIFPEKISFPVLIQEFIVSEKGIPGFSKKREVSDLRMIFINHRMIYAISRIAKKGSLFTNFHQGATAVLVPENKIPGSAKSLAKKIINKLSIYPEANYSLDFIFTNKGLPILVEMNTTPGFDLLNIVGNEELKEKHFREFIKVI